MTDREALLFVIDRGLEALDGEGAADVADAASREMKSLGLVPTKENELLKQYILEMARQKQELYDEMEAVRQQHERNWRAQLLTWLRARAR